LGLALGGALAITNHILVWPFLMLLALLAVLILALQLPALPYTTQESEPLFESHDVIMLVLLAAIALRSLVWTTLQYLVQMRWEMVLMLAVAAMVGKALGGFLADYVGWRRWTLGALLGAALLLNFGARQPWALMLGVALLQSATPAALAATLRLMPRQPATAAGLALGLAIALGGLPLLGGWTLSLGSPPILALIAASAALSLVLALTLQRRARAHA
jgi:FSR family fosmidomycin resistance protein-like MFS transporter